MTPCGPGYDGWTEAGPIAHVGITSFSSRTLTGCGACTAAVAASNSSEHGRGWLLRVSPAARTSNGTSRRSVWFVTASVTSRRTTYSPGA